MYNKTLNIMDMEDDNEITCTDLYSLISRHFSTEISSHTIRRFIRKSLEWEVYEFCTEFVTFKVEICVNYSRILTSKLE